MSLVIDRTDTPSPDAPLAIAPPGPARRADWRRAARLVRTLIADPEQTELVFDLMNVVGGKGHERCFQDFVATAEGRRLLRERPSLVAAMGDRAALASLPEGSFGRAYLDFAARREFAADGLVEINHASNTSADQEVDELRRYYFDRVTAMHDLWHVLTGYGTDEAGEATLLAFTLAQLPSRGIAVLVAAALAMLPADRTLSAHHYLLRAYRRGRAASPLDRARYEELLALPLDEVRRRLGVTSPREAHPRGILVGGANRPTEWVAA